MQLPLLHPNCGAAPDSLADKGPDSALANTSVNPKQPLRLLKVSAGMAEIRIQPNTWHDRASPSLTRHTTLLCTTRHSMEKGAAQSHRRNIRRRMSIPLMQGSRDITGYRSAQEQGPLNPEAHSLGYTPSYGSSHSSPHLIKHVAARGASALKPDVAFPGSH